jgi:serine/threonine-protein kinase
MATCNASCRARFAAAAFLGALLLGTTTARAQSASPGDQATARALFEDGRRLMKSNQYDLACPKLEGAKRLYPGSGVMLNLADCYEHTNRTATAWAEFGEAGATAARIGRSDDETEAKRRQAALEPKLSRILIHVAKEAPGLVVSRNGTAVDPAAWGTPIPVDPGTYAFRATLGNNAPWTTSVTISEPGKTVTVEVPDLAAKAASPPVASPPATATTAPPPATAATTLPPATSSSKPEEPTPPTSFWNGMRIASVVAGGAGIVALGVGGGVGLVAKSQYNTAKNETGDARKTDADSAVSTGNVATVVVIVGGALAAAGVVLWFTAPTASTQVGTNGHELFVRRSF